MTVVANRNSSTFQKIRDFFRPPADALMFYLAWCLLWMFTPVRLEYYGTDTFEYITITEKIISGHWFDAINGYWGPLISWILVPFMLVIKDPIIAFKILQIILGALVVITTHRLAQCAGLRGTMLRLFNMLIALMAASYALLYGTPDLLLLLLLLMYVLSLLTMPAHAVWHGLAGGLMFLAKAYALPFFAVHISLYYLLNSKNNRPQAFKKWLRSMAVLLVMVGCWATLLSIKYGKFTLSHSGTYNMALVGPTLLDPDWKMHPAFFGGLFPPANATAISAWEDPSQQPITHWNPLSSMNDMHHYVKVVKLNVLSFYYSHIQRQTGAVLFFVLLLHVWYTRRNGFPFHKHMWMWLYTAAIYTSGYMLVFPTTRYLWPVSIIFVLLLFVLCSHMLTKQKVFRSLAIAAMVLTVFLASKRALKELILLEDTDTNASFVIYFASQPSAVIDSVYAPFIYFDSLNNSGTLKFLETKNVAGIRDDQSYQYASFLGLHNRFRYYGELTDSLLRKGYARQLEQYAIEYLFVTDTVTKPEIFIGYSPELVLHDQNTRLRIYALKP